MMQPLSTLASRINMDNNRSSIKQLFRAMRHHEHADEQQLAGLSLSPSFDSVESSSPSVAGTVTSSSASSAASLPSVLSTKSSIKQRWEALALHRFLSPKSCGRESLPLSRGKLVSLLRLLPHAVTTTDRHGRTPLHLACHNRYVTAPIVSALLEAPGGKDALTMRDVDGFTPLHFSCRYHPDSHIISLLVKAEPRTTSMRDSFAATPLHYACSHLTSINSNDMVSISAPTVAILLKYDPSIALARDLSGVCPLALVCRKFDLICRHGFYGSPGRPRIVTFGSYLFLERTIPIFKAVCGWRGDAIYKKHDQDEDLDWHCSWDDVSGLAACLSTYSLFCLFIYNSYNAYAFVDSQTFCFVVIFLPAQMLYCSFFAMKTAIGINGIMGSRNNRVSYEFALLSVIHRCKAQGLFVDNDGNTTLHLACSIPVSSVPVGSRLLYPLTEKCVVRDKSVVDFLVRVCPEAAHKRNAQGRLPLHNMVEAEGSSWQCGIRAVLEANPSAVAELALESQLYSNILSRAGKDIGLSSVFSILRELPDLLAGGGDDESSLAQENEKKRNNLVRTTRKLRVRRLRRHRP